MIQLMINTTEGEFYEFNNVLLEAGYTIECLSFNKDNNSVDVTLLLKEKQGIVNESLL